VDGLTATLGAGTLFDKPPFQLGDWLDPAAPPENPTAAATDPILVATAYRVRAAQVLSDIAGILGQEGDSAKYADLAESVRQAFSRRVRHSARPGSE
jgi:alpha-L-rhamnosidase